MQFFSSQGVRLAYIDVPPESGSGDPVLLVHGFASNHAVNWVNTLWVTTLTRAGYRVIATDVLDAEGQAVAKAIAEAGGQAEFHRLDVTSTSQAEAVIGAVEKRHGPIDCIVANAGIAHKVPLDELSDEKWDHTFEIDLKGMIRVVRPAVPAMRKRGAGSIICVSSIMGIAYGWD